MSGFLFLLVADWIMQNVTGSERKGIRWNFNTVLGGLDFADNIALQCHPNLIIYKEKQIGWLMRQNELN